MNSRLSCMDVVQQSCVTIEKSGPYKYGASLQSRNHFVIRRQTRWTSEKKCRSCWMRNSTWMRTRLTCWRLRHVSLLLLWSRRPWPKPGRRGSEEKGRVCGWKTQVWHELVKYFREGDVKSFSNFVRMDPDKFNPGLNLAIILRCLATGDVYKSQAYGFRVVPITIVSVVPEVCKAIYDHYHKTAFKCPTMKEEWKEVAQTSGTSITAVAAQMASMWGCKLRLTRAVCSTTTQDFTPSSSYPNYKFVNVGAYGADCDAGIFRECRLYHVDCIRRMKLVWHQVNPCQVLTLMSPTSLLVITHLPSEAGWWSHTTWPVCTCLIWGAKINYFFNLFWPVFWHI